jgi:Effector-associated domain 1
MSLTPAQYEALTQLLSSVFDRDSLEQMLQFKLGKALFNLVSPDKGLDGVAFDLIGVAEREGWTEALVRAVVVSRPSNARVQEFVNGHWQGGLASQDAGQQVQAVKRGLEALIDLVRRLTDPAVGQIIGRYRADFRLTQEKVAALGRYKCKRRLKRAAFGR